jgi:hypothetical protein
VIAMHIPHPLAILDAYLGHPQSSNVLKMFPATFQ